MKSAWKILLCIWFVFFCTFIIFPGTFFDAHFKAMENIGSTEFTWYTLSVILTFNILDTCGRKLGGIVTVNSGLVYFMGLLRVGFVVMGIWIALDDSEDDMFIEKDSVKMLNLALFSISNGFVSTLCAIKAPDYVDHDQKEQIGIFVGLSIALGIVTGSIVAIPIGYQLPVNWPTN
jgi:equilibrative nucleoside transporter 1/2/3